MSELKEGYKKTEVGVIPEDWEVKRIGDVVSLLKSGLSRRLSDENIGIPCIRSNNIKDNRLVLEDLKYWYLVDDKGAKIEDYMLKKGDIIINFINSISQIGKGCIFNKNDFKAIYTTNLLRINTDESVIINKFFYYYTQTERYKKEVALITKPAVNQASFTTVDYKAIKLPIPPLKEQEKIVEILSTVDCQIDDTENLIEKCRVLKKGLMQRLLSRGIGHCEFRMSEVGEIPASWEVKKLGEICDFRQGFQISRDEQITEEKENFIRYLYITDFFSDQNKLYVKDSEKFYYINRDDIAIANTGNTCGKAFRGACGVLSNNMFKIFNDKNITHNDYLWQYLNSDIYWKQLNKYFNTAGQPHVGHKNMSMLLIALPSIEEQINISKILSYVDKDIEIYENKKQKLEELKKGLIQQLLTGKIRVI